MKIVYFYIAYIKRKATPDVPEVHACPFTTKDKAEAYKEKKDKELGDSLHFSKIKKVEVSKYEKGIWL